jgi:hypothetical protein
MGLMTGRDPIRSQSYPYDHEWKYKYSDFGKTLATAYQTNCFQGEAFAVYDPCGNMISLVAQSSGEVWARAVDKNSNQAIGSYNPHAVEIPFVGDGTVMPPYEEPIVSPIAFTIGGSGFNVKDHLASNTDLTIAIGQNGAHASIYGDDDCEDEICGGGSDSYNRCLHRCFSNCRDSDPSEDCIGDANVPEEGDAKCARTYKGWRSVREEFTTFFEEWADTQIWTVIEAAVAGAIFGSFIGAAIAVAIALVIICSFRAKDMAMAYADKRDENAGWFNQLDAFGLLFDDIGDFGKFEYSMYKNNQIDKDCQEYCKKHYT